MLHYAGHLLKRTDGLNRMLEHIPMMRAWLAHAPCRRKLWKDDREQAKFIEKMQSFSGSTWFKNCIQFIMYAFRGHLGKQSCISHYQALCPGIHVELVAHHQ